MSRMKVPGVFGGGRARVVRSCWCCWRLLRRHGENFIKVENEPLGGFEVMASASSTLGMVVDAPHLRHHHITRLVGEA